MEQVNKTGQFITEHRKKLNLTQTQLAEKLNIPTELILKWENGKILPDSSDILKLCQVLEIDIKELIIIKDQKETNDRTILILESFWGLVNIIIALVLVVLSGTINVSGTLRWVLIILGFALIFSECFFGLKIEQIIGYYKCPECGDAYIPGFKSVSFAPHIFRTRYMKCPQCNKKSWHRKIFKKY